MNFTFKAFGCIFRAFERSFKAFERIFKAFERKTFRGRGKFSPL